MPVTAVEADEGDTADEGTDGAGADVDDGAEQALLLHAKAAAEDNDDDDGDDETDDDHDEEVEEEDEEEDDGHRAGLTMMPLAPWVKQHSADTGNPWRLCPGCVGLNR